MHDREDCELIISTDTTYIAIFLSSAAPVSVIALAIYNESLLRPYL